MTGPELLRSRGWRCKTMDVLRGSKGALAELWEHNSQWGVYHSFESAIVDEACRLQRDSAALLERCRRFIRDQDHDFGAGLANDIDAFLRCPRVDP